MRKIKKINGFLVVKFNDREKREYTADFYLRKAIMATVGPELHEVTSEQVGILKLMKLAVETDRFMQQLKKEGREQYSIGEYVEKVYNPVMNL